MGIKKFIDTASDEELKFLRDKSAVEVDKEMAKVVPDWELIRLCHKVMHWVDEEFSARREAGTGGD